MDIDRNIDVGVEVEVEVEVKFEVDIDCDELLKGIDGISDLRNNADSFAVGSLNLLRILI